MEPFIDLFLLGIKGLSVLEEIIDNDYKWTISCVIVGSDKHVLDDCHSKIIAICKRHAVPYVEKSECNSKNLRGTYSFAVGWKWIINTKSFLIVFHDSILPKYRGFAPTVSQLINGEEYLGVTAFKASENYDEGDIITSSTIKVTYPLKISDALNSLRNCYSYCALHIISTLKSGKPLDLVQQDHNNATYSLWRDEEDYQINWEKSSKEIARFIDSVGYPYHGAKTKFNDNWIRIYNAYPVPDKKIENRTVGKVIELFENKPIVVCGNGLLCIDEAFYENTSESLIPLNRFRSRFS